MKKILFLIALFTLMGGVNSVKADDGTKTPLLLLKNGVINSTEFDITPVSPSTLTTDNLYAAIFTSKGGYCNTFKYTNLDVSDYDKAVVKYSIAEGNGDWHINLPDGSHTALTIGVDQVKEVSLSGIDTYPDFTVFSWNHTGKSITISEVYLYKSADPLAPSKATLSAKIALAEMYNALAYTTASFSDLTAEITTAQGALAAAESAESLTTATTNLQAKIDALVFKDGYTNLTADMFKSWNKADAADAVATGSVDCACNLFTSTDLPYGEGGVGYLHYADLSSYTTLYVITTDRRPRIMMNRDVNEGQWNATEAESHLIDNTMDGWSAKYFSNEGRVYSVDLETMVADKGFAHLNTIKVEGWGNKDIIKGMYLYKAPDPLAEYKEALSAKIGEANNKSSIGKTDDSWSALTTAKSNAVTALNAGDATEESLTNAKNALQDAIDGLKLKAGYANLTAGMFMTHAAVDDATVTGKPGCAYVINAASDQPYGDASVGEKNWADLTPYEQFIILTSGDTKPRICMNRQVKDGQQAATQAESKMIDINDNNGYTWSATKYQTIDGHKYTIDLEDIVTDYGFARVHAIKKQGWGDGVYVTDMLIYAAKSKAVVGAAGCATFSSIMNVDMTGVNAYAAQYDGEKVVLTPVTEVPANTGVIIEATAGTYELTNIESADAIADNDLKVSDGTVTGDGSTIFVLNKVGDNVGFYKLENGKKLEAGKAYLKIEGDISGARGIRMVYNSITDVNEIKAQKQKQGAKGVYYNLSGQRVSKPTKGLYIVDGKVVSF